VPVLTVVDVVAVLGRLGATAVVQPDRAAAEVTGVASDSRVVVAGDLYAALPGAHHHGSSFASAAVASGATLVLTDAAGQEASLAAGVPVIVVPDPRAVLGDLAAAIHGHPDSKLLVLGVTGTNGKTTSTYLLDAGLRAAGHRTGLVGTVETRVAGEVVASVRTTPEAPDLQRLLARMVDAGCTAVSMEVSSHALALDRVDGITYDVAVFTNLSQDHLDFHPTMDAYFAAKAELFTPRRCRHAVIDVDTTWGRELAGAAGVPVTTVSSATSPEGVRPDAQWRATDVDLRPTGSAFRVVGPSGESVEMSLCLPGPFNVSNALAAVVALVVGGVPLEDGARGIAGLTGVPGRMERVDCGQPFVALVDYAHTPEAVSTLLSAVRASTAGRVLVVLGCGGDRDPYKRPAMGAAAVEGADMVVLTSDNPRSEDPLAIIEQMQRGAAEAAVRHPDVSVLVEPDRAAAIARALRGAQAGDAVVVAGKGHEAGQEIAGVVLPFDDRSVVRESLSLLGWP
jgi:UDP-N-acetylmuramoyl-L-alanyl-D-glutamate--2,6-diaminopimelate ligase